MLVSNDNIVKAIGNNQSDFLNHPSVLPSSLMFNNIYPFLYVPEAQDEQKTYITIAFRNFRLDRTFYKIGNICFYVFSHYSLMQTDYGILRTDFIINQIDTIFNKTEQLGIGKLQFDKMDDIKISRFHIGSYIEYKDLSFN